MVSDRTVMTRLKADISDFQRGMLAASASAKAFTKELDTSTDRSTMLTQSLLAVGPALVPISAAAIPAISGLTNQLGFAVAGAGAAVLAFQGVGDALQATNDYALEPTEANLAKMRESLAELGPAGREFVSFLQEVRPHLQGLQDAAQAGLFPGMEDGIESLLTRLPQVERIVGEVSGAIGDLMAEAGDNLADPRWDEFFTFIENEARTTLTDLGHTIGNLGEGFANLWMAFDPLSDNFSQSFLQMSRDFAKWTDGLDQTEGFQEFVAYIERVGPKAWDTLGALGNALLQVVEAAAPVGEVALPVIEAVADVLAMVAGSPAGPVLIGAAAGISALSRAVSLYNVANGAALTGTLEKLGGKGAVFRSAAAGAGILALSMTDLDEKMGVSNTLMGAMAGSVIPGWGTAIGAAAGLMLDLSSQTGRGAEALAAFQEAFDGATTLEQQESVISSLEERISALKDLDLGILNGDIQDQVGALSEALSEMTGQHRDADRAAQDQRFAEAGLGDQMAGTTQSARDQTDALLTLLDARRRATEEALSSRDAERAYEAAIDDAAESIKQNGQTLDDGTPKGRANAAAIDGMIRAWNELDAASRESKGGLSAAINEVVRAAESAGASKPEIDAFVRSLDTIAPPPPIAITVSGVQAGIDAATRLGIALSNLHDKSITITTNRVGSSPGGTGTTKSGYTGMRVPNGYADGGRIPGTPPSDPTEDNVFAMTAKGNPLMLRSREWIINEPQSDKNDRWLRAINNGLNLDDLFGPMTIPGFASGGRYDDFKALTRSSKLDLARQEQQIIDITKSLKEKETVGKGKNKHTRLALRGHAREVAELELKEAKAELAKMKRENAALRNYGTEGDEERLNDAEELRKSNEQKAIDEAERVVKEAADRFTSTKSSAAQLFEIGTATSAAAVDRNLNRLLADSSTFLGLLGDLKSKNASPWLLGELVKAGPTPGAIKLARQYNTDQNALNSINARASQIDQYTNAYAGLVGNSAFMAPGAWNSGVSSASQAPVTASLVGAEVSVGQDGLLRFVKGQIVVAQNDMAIEARNTI